MVNILSVLFHSDTVYGTVENIRRPKQSPTMYPLPGKERHAWLNSDVGQVETVIIVVKKSHKDRPSCTLLMTRTLLAVNEKFQRSRWSGFVHCTASFEIRTWITQVHRTCKLWSQVRYDYDTTTTTLRYRYDFATSVARASCDIRAIKWQTINFIAVITMFICRSSYDLQAGSWSYSKASSLQWYGPTLFDYIGHSGN